MTNNTHDVRLNAAIDVLIALAAQRDDTLPNMMDTYSYTDDVEIDAVLDTYALNRTESTIDEIINTYDER